MFKDLRSTHDSVRNVDQKRIIMAVFKIRKATCITSWKKKKSKDFKFQTSNEQVVHACYAARKLYYTYQCIACIKPTLHCQIISSKLIMRVFWNTLNVNLEVVSGE